MKALIVYWHPEPKSFNGAMFRTARESLEVAEHEVKVSDLREVAFDPVSGRNNFTTVSNPEYFKQQFEEMHAVEAGGFAPELESEMGKVEWCDLMIWQFPLWWFGVPAALKGWVDRVFAMGRFYGGDLGVYENGACRGKRAMLSLTTGGPEESYRQGGFNGDIAGILRPIHRGIFQFTGFEVLAPQVVYGPARMSDEERIEHLAAYAARLQHIDREPPFKVGPY